MSDIDHRREVGDQFLSHYGKKGMRWGSRRGSTTAATVKLPGTRGYNPKKLSNDELNKIVKRMELEQKYSQLNKKKLDEGKKWREGKGDELKNIAFKTVGGILIAHVANSALQGKPIFPKKNTPTPAVLATKVKTGEDFMKDWQSFYQSGGKKKKK